MLRTYGPMKRSRGTQIPADVRRIVMERDRYCVCDRAGFPPEVRARCGGDLQLDHVRASHGIGMKSEDEPWNLVVLSAWCHRWKTENGRQARPLLLDYIARADDPHVAHVDPCGLDCRAAVPPR